MNISQEFFYGQTNKQKMSRLKKKILDFVKWELGKYLSSSKSALSKSVTVTRNIKQTSNILEVEEWNKRKRVHLYLTIIAYFTFFRDKSSFKFLNSVFFFFQNGCRWENSEKHVIKSNLSHVFYGKAIQIKFHQFKRKKNL